MTPQNGDRNLILRREGVIHHKEVGTKGPLLLVGLGPLSGYIFLRVAGKISRKSSANFPIRVPVQRETPYFVYLYTAFLTSSITFSFYFFLATVYASDIFQGKLC